MVSSSIQQKFVMTNFFSLQMETRLLLESYAIVLSYVLNFQYSLLCKEKRNYLVQFTFCSLTFGTPAALFNVYISKTRKTCGIFIILLNRFLLCNIMMKKLCKTIITLLVLDTFASSRVLQILGKDTFVKTIFLTV